MAIAEQKITDTYAIYNGDCMEVLPGIEDGAIHISVYSPPFSDLYNYSSSDRDLSNSKTYKEFLTHYRFVVEEIHRVMMPGRISCVHCMDIPLKGGKGVRDFPGDIIRMHEDAGYYYVGRRVIWKEPLRVAIRTRAKGLMHKQIVKDSSFCDVAGADYLLSFRKKGDNPTPITHSHGLSRYAGDRKPDAALVHKFKNWDDPKTNKLSHWIWQQYASSVWADIRINNVLEYKVARDSDEEKHVCPLQLDVIDRCLSLWSNPGETLLTPFMGVGSEVFGAIQNGRKAVGVELKPSYFRQAKRNLLNVKSGDEATLFHEWE
jgi:DNA modification methylase